MPRVCTSVIVSRPVAEVFDFLADARNLVLWSSGIAGIDPHPVSPGPNAEYRYLYPGRHREHRLTCSAYRPLRHVAFRGQRMWSPLGTQVPEYGFDMGPYGNGTLLRLSVISSLTAAMVLLAPVIAMAWRRDLPIDALKLCEVLGTASGMPREAGIVAPVKAGQQAQALLDRARAARSELFRPGVGA